VVTDDHDPNQNAPRRPSRRESVRHALEAMARVFEQEAKKETGEIREQRLQEARRWRELAEEFSRAGE